MLEKTLQKLADIKPGTYLPDDADCFDADEIDQLGRLLDRLVYAPSVIRKRLQTLGATLTRADSYSEIPTVVDIEQSFAAPSRLKLDQPFLDADNHLRILLELSMHTEEFDPPQTTDNPHRFAWTNDSFSYSDAMAYFAMIRKYKPKTIIEVGSGAFTLVALEAVRANGMGRVICVEPHPSDALRSLPGIELHESRIQDLDASFFNSRLGDGDILFIDTTHTVRHDSDCLHIYLRIIPELLANLYIHVHDIRLPETLTVEMMRDQQIFWNEQYLLYAYLLENRRTTAMFGSNYHHKHNPQALAAFMRGRFGAGGASFWFRQAAMAPGQRR